MIKIPIHLINRTTFLLIPFILLLGCIQNVKNESTRNNNSKSISVRNAHAMAYNSYDSSVYLFGGADEKKVLSDLWVLNENKWNKIMVENGPEPRTFSNLIYDKKNQRLILFGGNKVLFGTKTDEDNLLNDTWEFKNNRWNKLHPINSPTPRAESAMAYDELRETVVLFGGYKIKDGEYIKLGDTWEFKDNDWYLVPNSGPSERHGVSMAYDSANKSVMIFGGSTIDRQYGEGKGETWKWDGVHWEKLNIKQPEGIFNATMVYNKDKGEFMRFGGYNGKSRINETWSFKENIWNMLNIENAPTSRNHSNMVFDERENRIILYGGHDGQNIFGDTWEFKDNKWKQIIYSKVIKRIDNEH